MTESVRQSQHLIRRICIIAGEIHGVGQVENRLEIGLDELTDILMLVNNTDLLPNIEVTLRNSRDTILGQMGPGRENDIIIHSQLRRIRAGLRTCLDHCVVRRRGTIENLYYRLSSLRTELSALGGRILNDIVNMDETIRSEMRANLPISFGIVDFIEMQINGSRTLRVLHSQSTLNSVEGSYVSTPDNQVQQIIGSTSSETINRLNEVEVYIHLPNKTNVRVLVSPTAKVR